MSDETRDSTPVTFAAILAHHRRLAQDLWADLAWHAEVEWNSGFWGDDSGCSICGAPKTSGHAIDCRLAAALEVGHG